MQIKNNEKRYGVVAMLLHWGMAVLIVGLLILGLYMTDLPVGTTKLKFYGWHKEFGFLVLTLALVRFAWRWINILPRLPDSMPQWQKIGARVSHWAFYGFMFALPISGWLMTSAAGFPVSFFGLFVIPNLIEPNEAQRLLFAEIHEWLAYGLITTIGIHVAAALKHHFIDKDDILRRML